MIPKKELHSASEPCDVIVVAVEVGRRGCQACGECPNTARTSAYPQPPSPGPASPSLIDLTPQASFPLANNLQDIIQTVASFLALPLLCQHLLPLDLFMVSLCPLTVSRSCPLPPPATSGFLAKFLEHGTFPPAQALVLYYPRHLTTGAISQFPLQSPG